MMVNPHNAKTNEHLSMCTSVAVNSVILLRQHTWRLDETIFFHLTSLKQHHIFNFKHKLIFYKI